MSASQRVRSCTEIAILLGIYKTQNLEDIEKGCRKYVLEHGRRPSVSKESAKPYVGYATNWAAINTWLSNNGQGSLSQLNKTIGFEDARVKHNFEAIKKGVRRYCEEHGHPPSEVPEDAEPYVGYPKTWRAVSRWLRKNGHPPFYRLCEEMGFQGHRTEHNLEAITKGVQKYYGEHRKAPGGTSGDAKPYVEYPTTWPAIDQWLRLHRNSSLLHLSEQGGFCSMRFDRTVDEARRVLLKYFKKHGQRPTKRSSKEFYNMSAWLVRQGITIKTLCDDLGLPGGRKLDWTLEGVREAFRSFYQEAGRRPKTSEMLSANNWLIKHEGLTVQRLCDEMGLGERWRSSSRITGQERKKKGRPRKG